MNFDKSLIPELLHYLSQFVLHMRVLWIETLEVRFEGVNLGQ